MKSILNRRIDELEWAETDDTAFVSSGDAVDSIRSQIETILEKARSLDPFDPKLEALRKIIRDKQDLPNNKIMLFSSFRHTLAYLDEQLRADGIRVGMIHGGTPDEERVALRGRFEKPREDSDCLDVLLFSEVGCEGLDYQFCDCIVNYDLPWNPMRVEQRIGRIDRNGQQSESVAIVNLITPGTVDADIYERCLLRIGVFENALGGSEEILGDISREIRNIAENFSLSEEERRSRLQQLADNEIRLVQEQEKLEQGQLELFGIQLPRDQMKQEIEEATSYWLSPSSLHRMVTLYLQNTCGKEQAYILGDRPLKTLRLSQHARNSLLRDFQQLPRQNAPLLSRVGNLAEGKRTASARHVRAGLCQPESASRLRHAAAPAGQAGRLVIRSRATGNYGTLKVHTREVPAGRYEFAVYQWRYYGIRQDLVLKPIASSAAVTPQSRPPVRESGRRRDMEDHGRPHACRVGRTGCTASRHVVRGARPAPATNPGTRRLSTREPVHEPPRAAGVASGTAWPGQRRETSTNAAVANGRCPSGL